jgi:hypothetical protein
MADLGHFIVFQDGGGGHLGNWRHTSDFAFFELSMLFLVCLPSFIEIGP